MQFIGLVRLMVLVCRIGGGECYQLEVSHYSSEPACVRGAPEFLEGYHKRNPEWTVTRFWCHGGEITEWRRLRRHFALCSFI